MRTKSLALLIALAFVLVGLAGCDHIISFDDPAEKRKEAISNVIAGDKTSKIGETYRTKWFEFTVHTVEKVGSYADYTANADYQLYKVLLSLKNITDDSIAMSIFDFYMDDPAFEEYVWGIPPMDDTMMPESYDLGPDEAVQYVLIFEVPTNTTNLVLAYTETFVIGNDGTTFSIAIS